MKHTYTITALNNAVGIPPEADGVMMMFIWAVAVANTFALNTAYFLESPDDLDALGIDADYDATNATDVFGQISDFYAQAQDGAQIWLVGVPMDTDYATYCASATYKNLIYNTRVTDPLQRAKMIGLVYAPPALLQDDLPFPADVTAAMPVIQATQKAQFQTGTPYSVILDGYNMSNSLDPSGLPSYQTAENFAISLCITGLRPNGVSGVGFALGRFARISVGHGCGEVNDGALNCSAAFLTNSVVIPPAGPLVVGDIYTVFGGKITYNAVDYAVGKTFVAIMGHTVYTTTAGGYVADNPTPVQTLTLDDFNDLGDKQLFFLRTWMDYQGFFWNDAATLTSEDKAFSSQEYNRVVNRLAADVIKYFISYQGQNLPLQRGTTNISDAFVLLVDADFYSTYIEPLTVDSGSGDLTDAALTTTGINYLGTKRLKYKLDIEPTVIMGGADGTVEFASTL